MIVPDVNVLVYAFRAEAPGHATYATWLNKALANESIGLGEVILSGFLRIVTHPRIMSAPAPIDAALGFTRRLIDAPRSRWLTSGPAAWEQLERVSIDDSGIRGNLVPDAYIAALCLANGAKLLDDHPSLAQLRLVQALPPGSRVELVQPGRVGSTEA